ncbi:tyrosine-type recombinase/integrase [Methylobacterium indicum]|uniref:tyrosine-type recombinase/integrase n=1 Tax=Methylobacterium indicum TaxID=1775910 RepID=UPI0009E45767
MSEPLPSHSQHTSLLALEEEAAGLLALPPTSAAVSSADEPSERAESPLPALQPLAEAARAYAARKDSPNTRRAYASDWYLFERWCLRQGLDPLVPDPRIVGLFLAAAADGHGLPKVSVATLERRLAALTTRYRSAGTPLGRDDRHITDVMAGIRRSHARPPRQKEAVLGEDLLAMVATLEADLRGLRDKAILLLGFAGGLRRSEIVGLDCGPRQTTDGAGWIEILAEGALLTVRGKTGWRTVEVGRGSSERSCPVAALATWLRLGRIAHGPVFRSISGPKGAVSAARLSDKHVVRLVKRTAMAAGLRGDLPESERALAFAGHSLRAGLASSAEVEEALVQRQLGHASAEMTRRYQRRRERFRVNLTKASGL